VTAVYPNQNVLVAATLNTSAATADQLILTYTVPTTPIPRVLWLEYIEANVMLTTFLATATAFGTLSLRVNGTKVLTFTVIAGQGVLATPLYVDIPDPIPYQAGDVLTMVCTPSGVTPFTWEANLVGYLK
jgi:hypothetical protein